MGIIINNVDLFLKEYTLYNTVIASYCLGFMYTNAIEINMLPPNVVRLKRSLSHPIAYAGQQYLESYILLK